MIISADRVVFGDASAAPQKTAVRFCDGKITDVAPLSELSSAYPEDETVIYENATILPGLIDCHAHVALECSPKGEDMTNPYRLTCFAVKKLNEGLKKGVTTVRDVASLDGFAQAIRAAGEKGYVKVPRIIVSNQGLAATGGHGSGYPIVVECDGVDEVRKAVRTQIKKGAEWIKLMDSEGYRGQEFNQEELNAAVEEAHRFNIPVAVHAGWEPSVAMCVRAGVDSIEHGTSLTMEDAETMARNNQALVPTIIAFTSLCDFLKAGGNYLNASLEYPLLAVEKAKNVKAFYDAGVKIGCGTDNILGILDAYPVALEAKCMVDFGLTPLQAIEAATKNGADILRKGDSLGQIKAGYIADILVVDGDPCQNIDALQNVKAVYFGGEPVQ